MKVIISILVLIVTTSCSSEKKESFYPQNQIRTDPEIVDSSITIPPTSQAVLSTTSFLVERTILNEIKILMPRDFKRMSDEMIALKYPMKKGSAFIAYTNIESTINVAFDHTYNKALLKDLPAIKQVLERQFKQPGIDFKKSSIRKLNGREFIVIEMVTPAVDAQVYNLMFVTSLHDRLLIGTFNCTSDNVQQWESIAAEIVNSVTINN